MFHLRFSDVFRGCRSGTLVENELIMLSTSVNGLFTFSPSFANSNDGRFSRLAKLVSGSSIPEK